MTASKKKTVRTRRGVEPAGRPARREVERGRGATNELVQDVRADVSMPRTLERARASGPRAVRRTRRDRVDRSALCDFFDSQRAFAPPGRVRGPRAARKGSGALGVRVLAGSCFLGTPDTRPSRARAADGKWHNSTLSSSHKLAEAASRRRAIAWN